MSSWKNYVEHDMRPVLLVRILLKIHLDITGAGKALSYELTDRLELPLGGVALQEVGDTGFKTRLARAYGIHAFFPELHQRTSALAARSTGDATLS
jgi:hypothetical protein